MNFEKTGKYIDKNLFPISHQLSSSFLAIVGIWLVFWYPDASKRFTEGTFQYYWWFKQPTIYITIFIAIINILTSFIGSGKIRKLEDEIQQLQTKNNYLSSEANRIIDDNNKLNQQIEDAEETIYYNKKEHQDFVYESLSKYLMHISSDHLFFSDTERISIYRHHENEFFIAGRYSQNINNNKKSRIRFPDNEGCIGDAWSTGNPIVKFFKAQKGRNYNTWQTQECCIPAATIGALRMKSNSYCAIPIHENASRIGVLLFESTCHDRLELDSISSAVQEHYSFLIELLKESISTSDEYRSVKYMESKND